MTAENGQLAALQRIAAFSAALRGHELGHWETGHGCALACCVRCGAQLRVYFPALQPDMDGTALELPCNQETASGRAA